MLKNLLPRTLFGRVILIIVTPIVLLQIIATYAFYERHWSSVARRLAKGVGGEIALVIEGLRTLPDEADRQNLLDMARRHLRLEVTFRPGETLPPRPEPGLGAEFSPITPFEVNLYRALNNRLVDPFWVDAAAADDRVEIRVQLEDGVLSVIARSNRFFSPTIYVFMAWMVLSALILLAIAILFLRNQLRPIRQLAEAADTFGKGREPTDFRPTGAVEVRQAARAFLRMRERIARQINQRTEMLAGVSHDLRTPLTRMRLQLALFGDTPDVRALISDVDDMEQMVEAYMAFAQGQDQEPPVATDLPELLAEIASDARRQGSHIDLSAGSNLRIVVRPNAVKRCISNLVENARRHADHVAISVRQARKNVEIMVDDDGPGIRPEQREAAFRPFHRLEQSRNLDTGGSGLGLAVARDVARGHGGDIILGTAPMGGLRAVVRLPI